MLAVFIIIIFILAAGGYAISRRKSGSLSESNEYILAAPTEFEGLFDKENSEQLAAQEEQRLAAQRRAGLLERAQQFDLQVLDETHSETAVYNEILIALIEQTAESQDRFQALVGHISKSGELRANVQLAEKMMEHWKTSPGNKSTAQMLHLAALSDDAALLKRAIEMADEALQKGLLPKLFAKDFLALAESEYWVLAPEARRSGAGFILKNSLADLRRTLAATMRG
jgi:hypothetical protein